MPRACGDREFRGIRIMRKGVISMKGIAAVLVLAGAGTAPAHAAWIKTVDGNDCAGAYGKRFPNCVVPADPAHGIPKDTPIILKITLNADGSFSYEINPAYSSIDGSEFSIDFGADGNSGTGTWTYTPGAGDPTITAFVAKGGDGFNLFSTLGDYTDVTFYTPNNPNGKPAGLSHLSFYDAGDQNLPEPGTLALLGLGLLGIGAVRRARS
jgi:hypothetical protein